MLYTYCIVFVQHKPDVLATVYAVFTSAQSAYNYTSQYYNTNAYPFGWYSYHSRQRTLYYRRIIIAVPYDIFIYKDVDVVESYK